MLREHLALLYCFHVKQQPRVRCATLTFFCACASASTYKKPQYRGLRNPRRSLLNL